LEGKIIHQQVYYFTLKISVFEVILRYNCVPVNDLTDKLTRKQGVIHSPQTGWQIFGKFFT